MRLKYIFLFALLVTTLAACRQTPEQHIQELITASLKERLNDPDSYVSVKFSAPQKAPKPFECTLRGSKITDSVFRQLIHLTDESYYNHTDIPLQEWNKQKFDTATDLHKIYTDSKDAYEKQPEYYYQVTHTYRAKNKFGGVITKEEIFYATPDMQMLDTAIYCDKETLGNAQLLNDKNWNFTFRIMP